MTGPDAPLCSEIVDSLRTGDHLTLSHLRFRGLVGLPVLHLAALLNLIRGFPDNRPKSGAIQLVLGNPVRHGAQLGRAVIESARLEGIPLVVIADRRLSDPDLPVDHCFPSFAVRSSLGVPSLAGLGRAWRLVREVRCWPAELVDLPWGYRAYLVILQVLRYELAEATVRNSPPGWVLVTDFDRSAYARPLVHAARARKALIVTLVHGTPSPATYLPILADRVFVWGEAQREFFAEYAPQAAVTIVGRPEIDRCLTASDNVQRLVFCHSLEDLSSGELSRLGQLITEAKKRGIECVLRPHPLDPTTSHGGGWPVLRDQVDSMNSEGQSIQNALRPGDVVISVVSTSAVDALAVGARALVVADMKRPLSCDLIWIRDHFVDPFKGGQGKGTTDATELRLHVVAATGQESRRLVGRALRAMTKL